MLFNFLFHIKSYLTTKEIRQTNTSVLFSCGAKR
ncbi:MAG: hypothetical protein H6R19_1174 [Proteobacteria bacterium]|nr:hypothetical protein [Pseudomonadota bacterium]